MKDERFDPEELERVRAEAARHGRDEAEEQRLMELGRRAEALLASPEPPPSLRSEMGAFPMVASSAWAWFRSALKEEPHG